jgi:prepilin-type processing-associated H-X9-DG protein/prepilin-type N-terminal cleavage/methylation domain-containing protein
MKRDKTPKKRAVAVAPVSGLNPERIQIIQPGNAKSARPPSVTETMMINPETVASPSKQTGCVSLERTVLWLSLIQLFKTHRKLRLVTSSPALNHARAFTLAELLVVIAMIAILSAILLPVLNRGRLSAQCAVCQSNLRQLGLATQMYWNDNGGNSFSYFLTATNHGMLYWFGWIANGTEGHRPYDLSTGALFPYLNGSDTRLCPSPVWSLPQFELKGTNVIFSYGCNSFIFGGPGHSVLNTAKIIHPAGAVIIADAAEVNNFQLPASASHPLFEEWYYVDLETNYSSPNNYPNTHFRHSQMANVAFADGHVDLQKFVSGSIDPRLPSLYIGQLPPQILTVP